MADSGRHSRLAWVNVFVAAIIMVATLPGRTQGLGLITEPLLRDVHIGRVMYAQINLWATLIGGLACLPFGWAIDRFGLRWTTAATAAALGIVVWGMQAQAGSAIVLFLLILATRALGQSALSVASITAVGKSFGQAVGLAMGVYSVLISLFFASAFTIVGAIVRTQGWRAAWIDVALALTFVVAPLVGLLLRVPDIGAPQPGVAEVHEDPLDVDLSVALRSAAFWAFGAATASFALVTSGLGLFNEAVLAERGFDQRTYHTFLAVTVLVGLVGQFLWGWLTTRWPMQRLLAMAMFLYALALAGLPELRTMAQLWLFAALMGISGGAITVLFFAIWSYAFGRAHLGWIQGTAQMLTVVASAVGPLLFAECASVTGSYAPLLWVLAPTVFVLGVATLRVPLPNAARQVAAELTSQAV
jgi:MFS family permease